MQQSPVPPDSSTVRRRYGDQILPCAAIAVLFLVVTFPLALKSRINTFDQVDETAYHYPTIITFAEHFPNLDLASYNSGSTPLYYIFFSIVVLILGPDITTLRIVNLALSLACVVFVYWYLDTRHGKTHGFVFASIFMLSAYFIGGSVRLSTDNLALFLCFLSIISMDTSILSKPKPLLTSILILLTILTRQVYAWLAPVYILLQFQGLNGKQTLMGQVKRFLPIAIPIVGLLCLALLWRGSTPLGGALAIQGDAVVYILSLVGIYGSFFSPWYFREFKKDRRIAVVIAVLIALCFVYLWLRPVSGEYTFGADMRGGWLWLLAAQLPTLLSSPIIYYLFFPLGISFMYLIFRGLFTKKDYLPVLCFLFWLVVSMMMWRVWQKYYEPFTLFFLGYATQTLSHERWYYWILPILLIVVFLEIALIRFF